jgi:hypothetical protein
MEFTSEEGAIKYLRAQREKWPNLTGYIEQKNGKWYVWLNVID